MLLKPFINNPKDGYPLILVPAGIALALKLIPAEVMAEAREKAQQEAGPGGGVGKLGAVIIVLLWVLVLIVLGVFIFRLVKR